MVGFSMFNGKNYKIIRNLISKEYAIQLRSEIKQQEFNNQYVTCVHGNCISPGQPSFSLNNTKSMTEFHENILNDIEKHSGYKLYPTYIYGRIYKHGSHLKRHTDRAACEVSITLDLGGDPYDIWLSDKGKEIKIQLGIGDALLYNGIETEHWREEFKGNEHSQLFVHFVNKNGPYEWAKYDIKQEP